MGTISTGANPKGLRRAIEGTLSPTSDPEAFPRERNRLTHRDHR
ncbi:hypothetical protein [Halomontanus rarus]|nr:hypothetical protein [Halovivax sp. TS33]